MPSGLESIWTYVDPSTMQGVAAGVVLAFLALLVLASYSFLGRLGLLAEGEAELTRVCEESGFLRKRGWLRPRIVVTGAVEECRVTLILRFKRGRAQWALKWKRGGGSFFRQRAVGESDPPLVEWLISEVGRASR